MFSMKLQGAADLARKLDALSKAAERKVIVAALKAGAAPMKAEASQLAPREAGTPDMADAIDVVTVRMREGITAPTVAVGLPKRFFYDWFNEFGTVKQSANPFWRPAFDRNIPATIGIVTGELWDEIRRRIGRGSSRSAADTSGNRRVL